MEGSGARAGTSLTDAIQGDGGKGRVAGAPKLNPTWVEWLMGLPMGWTDPASQLVLGDCWGEDPAEVGVTSRTTDRKRQRVARLRALGNGQVPQCLVFAWEALRGRAMMSADESARDSDRSSHK